MDGVLADAKLRPMWDDMIAIQEGVEEFNIQKPGGKLEQRLRRTALTGIHVGHLTKKYGKAARADDGPDYKNPVYASWSKDGKPIYRTFTGLIVRQQDIVWFPTPFIGKTEELARDRWHAVRVSAFCSFIPVIGLRANQLRACR